jgi:hypothetical protein
VSELPISSPYRSTPDAPVSEAERNQLSTRLNDAFEAGTLEADDYKARLDQLFAAQRMGDLLPVVRGLPPLQTYSNPSIVEAGNGRPGELSQPVDASRAALIAVGVVGVAVLVVIILLLVVIL